MLRWGGARLCLKNSKLCSWNRRSKGESRERFSELIKLGLSGWYED